MKTRLKNFLKTIKESELKSIYRELEMDYDKKRPITDEFVEKLFRKRVEELYYQLGYNYDEYNINNDIEHDYLTDNVGKDKRYYYWYCYEERNGCVNVKTGTVFTTESKLEKLFY